MANAAAGRRRSPGGEFRSMPDTAHHAPELERRLLRKAVGRLAADRHRCTDCGRTPLTGERVHVYPGEAAVCDLCRPLRHGAPVRDERVHGSEWGHAVRLTDRRAA